MQSFLDCFASAPYLVGDGSIYERITRGGLVRHDPHIASASAIYDPAGRKAMAEFYTQYWDLAAQFGLPMVSTASTRKATFESIAASPFAGRPSSTSAAASIRTTCGRGWSSLSTRRKPSAPACGAPTPTPPG